MIINQINQIKEILVHITFKSRLTSNVIFPHICDSQWGRFPAYNLKWLCSTCQSCGHLFYKLGKAGRIMIVQGMLDNDIVRSSTAGDGTIDTCSESCKAYQQSTTHGNWSRERPSRTSIGPLCIRIFSKYFNPESQTKRRWSTVYDSNCSLPVVFILFYMNRRWTHWSTFIIYSSTRFLAWKRPSIFLWSRFTSCSIHRTLWKFCTLASKHESNVDGVQFGDLIEFVDMDFDNRVLKVNGACAQDWRCGNSDKHQELLRKPLWIPRIPVFWRAIPLWCGRKTQMLMGDTKS